MIKVEQYINNEFVDISEKVLHNFTINDSMGKFLDNIELTLVMNSDEIIPPKTLFRINNDWLFKTGDVSGTVTMFEDNTWTHKISLVELLKDTEFIQCSNYTVTLDKRMWYETDRHELTTNVSFTATNVFWGYEISPRSYDTRTYDLLATGEMIAAIDDYTVASQVNSTIKILNKGGSHRLRWSIIYYSDVDVELATIKTRTVDSINPVIDIYDINYGYSAITVKKAIPHTFYLQYTLVYYLNNSIVLTEVKSSQIIDSKTYIGTGHIQRHISANESVFTNASIEYDYCLVSFAIKMPKMAKQTRVDRGILISTYRSEISSYAKNVYVLIDSVWHENTQYRIKTLADVIDKVLRDINYEKNTQYELTETARGVLSNTPCPELTLEGYNLKELLFKLFSIANRYPVIGYKTNSEYLIDVVPYITTSGTFIEQLSYSSFSKLQDNEYTYDKGLSDVKNLVDEYSYHTEEVYFNSPNNSFMQITDNNFAFQTQYPIYFVRKVILKNLSINYMVDGVVNTAKDIDITNYVLEIDEYNALPDVSMSNSSVRSNSIYSENYDMTKFNIAKGNTIYYTSGERFIRGGGHLAPPVPGFWAPDVQNFALAEVAIRSVYDFVFQNYPNSTVSVSVIVPTLNDISNYFLAVTYVPILDTRATFFNSDKKQFLADRIMNYSDKVVSYRDLERSIRENQDKQGNVMEKLVVVAENLNELFDVGTYDVNNYIITDRNIRCRNNYIECEYTMQKNATSLNEEVALDIAYSRYLIPYEFLIRYITTHIFIEFSMTIPEDPEFYFYDDYYGSVFLENLIKDRNSTFYQSILFTGFSQANEMPPSVMVLNKVTALYARKGVMLLGSMIDNYGAGGVVIKDSTESTSVFIGMPVRYTDARGQVDTMTVKMGSVKSSYDWNKYPLTVTPPSTLYTDPIENYYISYRRQIDKDARERIDTVYNINYYTNANDLFLVDFSLRTEEKDTLVLADISNRPFEDVALTNITPIPNYNLTYGSGQGYGTLTYYWFPVIQSAAKYVVVMNGGEIRMIIPRGYSENNQVIVYMNARSTAK